VQHLHVGAEHPQRPEEIPQTATPPTQLLHEQLLEVVGHDCPALRLHITVRLEPAEQQQVGHVAVFAIAHANPKPVPLLDGLLDRHEVFAPHGKQTSRDAHDVARPVLHHLADLERVVVDQRLASCEDVLCRVAHPHASTHRADGRVGKARHHFLDGRAVKDAIRIDADQDLSG